MIKKIINKINLKQLTVVASVMIFIGIMLILIPKNGTNNLSNYIGNVLSYNDLSESRKYNYDKMKISHLNITSRKTGTEPFNSGDESNEDGIDVSSDDNYVRTFDQVMYNIEVGIVKNEKFSSFTNSNGGVIKVQATLPNQGDNTLMEWVSDAWMQNVTISSDKRTIYAEYIGKEDENFVGALQTLSFTLKISGYKKEITEQMKPTFEIWMEGNKPDNSDSSVESLNIKDDKPLVISGSVNLDFDIRTSNIYSIENRTINDVKYKGRRDNMGIGISIAQKDSNMPDLRGLEYPSGKIEIKAKLKYQYRNIAVGGWITLTEKTPNAINKINGFTVNGSSLNGAPGKYGASSFPYGKLNLTSSSKIKNSAFDSGTFDVKIIDDELVFTFENYKFNDNFPTTPYYGGVETINNKKYGYFAIGAFRIFMPYYDSENDSIDYDYQLIANVVSSTYKDTNGNEKELTSEGKSVIQDVKTTNNSTTVAGFSYLKGDASLNVMSLSTSHVSSSSNTGEVTYALSKPYTDDNGSIVKGGKYQLRITSKVTYGPFEGGADNLLVWNPNLTSIVKYDDGSWFNAYATGTTSKLTNVKINFGIYKSTIVGKVPETNDEINKSKYDSFDWYDTYEEAITHGKVSAVYFTNTEYRGNNLYYAYTMMFQAVDDFENIGKTIVYRSRLYYYANEDSRETKKGIYTLNDTTNYLPATYENGVLKSIGSPNGLGETILILGVKSSVTTSVTDLDTSNKPKGKYDVQEGEINVIVTPSLKNGATATDNDKKLNNVIVKSVLPKGLTYKQGSANKTPESVEIVEDETIITWKYDDYQINHDAPVYKDLTFKALISSSLDNNESVVIKSIIETDEDKRDEQLFRTGTYGVMISNLNGISSIKDIEKAVVNSNEEIVINTKVNNNSDTNLTNLKTLEILPRNGVGGSKFSGTYETEITKWVNNQKIYYTTNNITNIGITKDSYGKDTIKEVDLETDTRWKKLDLETNKTIPKEATAIATVIDRLNANSSCTFTYKIKPEGNIRKDKYVFSMNTTSNELVAAIMTNSVVAQVREYTVKEEHYYEGQTEPFETETKYYSYGDSYETHQLEPGKINYNKYEFKETKGDSLTGEVTKNILVKYYYNLRTYKLTVLHYISGIATPIKEETNKLYEESYVTDKHKDIDYNIYELDSTRLPDNADGKILGDTEVRYYYVVRKYDLTVHHYKDKEGSKEKVANDEEYKGRYIYEENYETTKASTLLDDNYDPATGYIKSGGQSARGVVKGNIEVEYYYKLKKADIIVNHLETGTNKVVAPQEIQNGIEYTKSYTTKVSTSVPKNYAFVKVETEKNAPTEGIVTGSIVNGGKIIINYYYTLKDSSGEITVSKEGTKTITKKDEVVKYEINYTAKAKDYIGTGTIKIVDALPYKINKTKSSLDGGTYNESTKTITWEINWTGIDTYDGEKEKTITKKIDVVYEEIKDSDVNLTNKVTGYLALGTKQIEPVNNQTTSEVKIPGKVIIKYIDIETEEDIIEPEEKTGFLYENYSSEGKSLEEKGYDLVEKPSNEIVSYTEVGTELVYKYKKKEFKIITKAIGYGGYIEGDEIVKYGEDSTEDKIKIKSKEGYEVEKITINGEEIEIKGDRTEIILEYFKNVVENKTVEVRFRQLPVKAPNTSSRINMFSVILGIALIFVGSLLIIIQKKHFRKVNY